MPRNYHRIRKMLVKRRRNTLFSACSFAALLFASPVHADRIAAGDTHSYAATYSSSQFVWGANDNGQLGDGTTLDALNPVPVVDIRFNPQGGAIAVSTQGDNTLVLRGDGTLRGWGPNENLQLGSGLLYSSRYFGEQPPDDGGGTDPGDGTDPPPEAVSTALTYPAEVVDPDGDPINNITDIALGPNFAAAINQNGNVLVWGKLDAFKNREQSREPANRYRDKFLDPTVTFIDSKYKGGAPVSDYELMYMQDVYGNRYIDIVDVAVGDNHLLALTNTGQILAWGENESGQLADGTLKQRPYPVFVRSSKNAVLSGITQVAARGNGAVAVSNDGSLLGWGSTLVVTPVDEGTDNTGTDVSGGRPAESYAEPVADSDGNPISNIRRVAVGSAHMLGITLSSGVIGWGSNSNGQLGDGTNSAITGTTTVVLSSGQPLNSIIEIAVGSTHSLALHSNGQVFAWGNGENGRLGDGTNVDSYYAVNVRDIYNGPFSLF